MEIKEELYSKLHLPERGFEAQQKKDSEDHGTACLHRDTMGLRHSSTCS